MQPCCMIVHLEMPVAGRDQNEWLIQVQREKGCGNHFGLVFVQVCAVRVG